MKIELNVNAEELKLIDDALFMARCDYLIKACDASKAGQTYNYAFYMANSKAIGALTAKVQACK